MNHEITVVLIASVIGTIVGLVLSILISRKYLRKKIFTPSNSVELVKRNRHEEWNEVRVLNPGWKADLKGVVCDGAVLPTVNFSRGDLSGGSFKDAVLDGANFY